jgi:hypothetical protein
MSRKAQVRKRERQRKKHMMPKQQQYSPLSRGLLAPSPTPLGIMQAVLAEDEQKPSTAEAEFEIRFNRVLAKRLKKTN